ncbi:hypothetical protein HAX54_037377 [Datura stramonium]|uniref:Uncharacterized protein n=1 Tax=Datura stramonium TaxID=4076 RepID=A0ABS8VLF7_DATST|nr:hypothetical protein [Datura stramonium]
MVRNGGRSGDVIGACRRWKPAKGEREAAGIVWSCCWQWCVYFFGRTVARGKGWPDLGDAAVVARGLVGMVVLLEPNRIEEEKRSCSSGSARWFPGLFGSVSVVRYFRRSCSDNSPANERRGGEGLAAGAGRKNEGKSWVCSGWFGVDAWSSSELMDFAGNEERCDFPARRKKRGRSGCCGVVGKEEVEAAADVVCLSHRSEMEENREEATGEEEGLAALRRCCYCLQQWR